MATEFAQPPKALTPPFAKLSYGPPYNVRQQRQQQQPYKPALNTAPATPTHVSPTSPRTPSTPTSGFSALNFPNRQLRQPKSPLYVPAVLRPTEKPLRHSPPRAAAADGSSAPLASGSPENILDNDNNGSNNNNNNNAPGTPASASAYPDPQQPLLRRHTSHSLDLGALSPAVLAEDIARPDDPHASSVTGPPTTTHWQPDSSHTQCTSPGCARQFTFFTRRHHCRRCGGVFCAAHSAHLVRLNQHALFHPRAAHYRACDRCFWSFREWESRRGVGGRGSGSRSGSENSSELSLPIGVGGGSGGGGDDVGGGGGAGGARAAQHRPGAGGFRVGSVAASVPKDWNWSTF